MNMAMIENFFGKIFTIVVLILGLILAFRIMKNFYKGTWKGTLAIFGAFLLSVVIISGTTDWIKVAKNTTPTIAGMLQNVVPNAVEFIENTIEFATNTLAEGTKK